MEQNAEHPIAEPAQPIADRLAICVALMARLDDEDWAVPLQNDGGSVEDAALMALDINLDQIEPGKAALCGERIEAAQRDLQSLVPGRGGSEPGGAGIDARRGYERDGELRSAVVVGDRAPDDFGLTQSIRSKGCFERGSVARRRLYRDNPPRAPDRASERHRPFPKAGPDIDDRRSGPQEAEDRRVHLRGMEQGMPAAGVERGRHIDNIAGAMQREAARPLAFEPI